MLQLTIIGLSIVFLLAYLCLHKEMPMIISVDDIKLQAIKKNEHRPKSIENSFYEGFIAGAKWAQNEIIVRMVDRAELNK